MPRPALLSWLRRRHRQAAVLVMRHPLLQRVPPGRRILEVLDLIPDTPASRLAAPRPRFYPGFLLDTDAPPPAPLLSSVADALDRALSLDGMLDAPPPPLIDELEQRPLIRAAASDAPILQSAAMVETRRPPAPAAPAAPPATRGGLEAEPAPPPRERIALQPIAEHTGLTPAPSAAAGTPSVPPSAPAPERVELQPTPASPLSASTLIDAAPELPAAAMEPAASITPTAAEPLVAASMPPDVASPSPGLPLTAEARLIAAVREVFAHERAREGIATPAPATPAAPVAPPPMVAAPEPTANTVEEPEDESVATAPVELPMPSPAEPAAPSPPALAFEQRQARRPPGAREGAPPPRPPRPPDPAPPASAPELFTPADDRRGPLDWLKRLVEATSTTAPSAPTATSSSARPATPPAATPRHRLPPAAPRPATPAVTAPPAPTPLAPSTRRFLRPLIGIDPDSVRVHRGPLADAVTTAHGADALTVGDDIVLASGQDERSPETLGLLAHELTHVARQRSPRFVPPVAQGTAARRAESHAMSTMADEETLARHVESEVRAAASAPRISDPETSPPEVSYASVGGHELTDAPHAAVRSAPASPPWGSLPAPWEPMPMSAPVEVTSSVSAPMFAPSPSAASEVSVPIPVQLAEQGRSVEAAEHPAEQHHKESAHGVPPDIDALARQVYDVLKRRLAAERRRHS